MIKRMTVSSEGDLLVERAGAVLWVWLNRPDRLNALNGSIRDALEALWTTTASDRSVRCVVLTGAGRGFCAGADVSDLAGPRAGRGDLDAELAFLPGRNLEVPVVVAVNGVCAGGGLHFVADADLCISGSSARFLDPHVSVGQVTGIEPASMLAMMSAQQVARLAYLGSAAALSAEEALAVGLVAEVVADNELISRAGAIADSICAGSPAAIRASRRVLRAAVDATTRPAMVAGWDAVQEHWSHPDALEGPVAHSEKRPPRWQ
jgi:enoyl-CoA hydratase/carnithine racemase